MSDATYQPAVYKKQGGNELVVGPSGILTIEGSVTGLSPGDDYFVGSVTGVTGNSGLSFAAPKATLIQGQTLATASVGDRVFVMPGHAEAIIAAAGMTFSKAGVTYIGLGVGRNRPTITFSTDTAAQMIVSGANITFRNFVFDLTGVSAIIAAISVTGADVSFEDCEFIISTGTNAPVLGILTAATATRLRIERCRFLGAATSTDTCTACIKHEVGVDYVIRDCYFTGKMTQAILNATACLRGLIDSNRFVVATGTLAISVHSSSTPFITNNRINVPSGTTPITAAAGFVAGNVYSAAAGVTAGTAVTI
jgi:hypothetical protein